MPAKGIHHIGLTVNNWAVSAPFYKTLAAALGASPFIENEGAPHRRENGNVIIFAGPDFMFSVWEAFEENKSNQFKDYNVGLHHFAFNAVSREAVNELYEQMKAIGAEIVDAPQEYDYVPGYYAVFFRDPDGLRIEYAYVPG
ncbi:Glyoxalase/bleomycin resistance protein/dioxygenase [Methylophaga frappieri]|uniref:Glyoxalase/bleomycin resistance protein/dioxygenase n=1 Tax=Methylophaga frappieri (strain ATCC BAA-2434 / DSM 25690 / JAM7) TaxID=754477 RepID=I1YLB7_METFJ|nr:VOC family protein [Methylophaga frappieri]AFJ03710.1 Glyoxalase/bleomycin resistance protein/dioxygenase [Methylophaga frappieri]